MSEPFRISVSRRPGDPNPTVVEGATQAEAFHKASELIGDRLPALVRELLDLLGSAEDPLSTRSMLEGTDESGRTEELLARIEKVVVAAEIGRAA